MWKLREGFRQIQYNSWKTTRQSKKKEDKQSTQLKKSIFVRQSVQYPAGPLKKEVTTNVSVMGREASAKYIPEFSFYVLGMRGEFELQVRNGRC